MRIFEYLDYKRWVLERLAQMPKGGRGQFASIAKHLGASPTIVTQVFNGPRELTPEQALLLAEYFGLSKLETRYLITIVNHSRAGTHRYKQSLAEEIAEIREKAREISSRVAQNASLSEEAWAIFYSNWYFLAIWSLTSMENFRDIESISNRLGLDKKKTREAVDFLIKYSLIVEGQDGKLMIGPTMIHLDSHSLQIARHHQNWRLQAFRHYENPGKEETFYTAAVTLSEADVAKIREMIISFISTSNDLIRNSPSEKLYCICMDWFEV